ncbi:hypothetical protein Scep_011921 [Stephania cephalantha]|uniref:Uncharacterized protein n=1 Tax=Stephania cephalantha TaxID=152367 RepID=A0AAP0JG12_9MAGN
MSSPVATAAMTTSGGAAVSNDGRDDGDLARDEERKQQLRWEDDGGSSRWRGWLDDGAAPAATPTASPVRSSDAGEEERQRLPAAAVARGTAWSKDAVARCRADRSPKRQQQWTRRRDFDEA